MDKLNAIIHPEKFESYWKRLLEVVNQTKNLRIKSVDVKCRTSTDTEDFEVSLEFYPEPKTEPEE